jgi:hypothetical protein
MDREDREAFVVAAQVSGWRDGRDWCDWRGAIGLTRSKTSTRGMCLCRWSLFACSQGAEAFSLGLLPTVALSFGRAKDFLKFDPTRDPRHSAIKRQQQQQQLGSDTILELDNTKLQKHARGLQD